MRLGDVGRRRTTSSQPATSATASIGRRRTAAKIAVASVSTPVTGDEPMIGHDLRRRSTSGSECSRSAMSAATRSIRGSTVLSTASPIRKKLNAPTATSASSVVSSRPRLPGVTRAWPKRAREVGDRRDGLEHEVPDRARDLGQRAPAAACRRARRSSRARAARASGLRRRWISATIPPTTTMNVPSANSAARDVGRELVDRAPEQEAEHAERDRPQAGGEHVVGQEAAQRHPRGAGDERRSAGARSRGSARR